jgi:hypothetical protein
MEARWREQPFWQLEYRRVRGEPLVRFMWGASLLGAGALVLAAAFGLAVKHGFASPFLSLTALVVAHLVARGELERRLPNVSFARDLQTGHLEQFRMLDLSPHALLWQRGFPALFYRLLSHSLWLPLYGAWGSWAGVPIGECALLWLLIAFASPLVLILLSFYLTLAFLPFWEPLTLGLLVLFYGSLREKHRARMGALSGWLFALIIGLAMLVRLLVPVAWLYPLPDIGRFVLVWLFVEGLNWERRARWLNTPSGLWQYLWLLPAAGLMLMAFPLVWEWARGWSEVQRLQGAAVVLFLLGSWLNRLLLTTVRGRDPVQQRVAVHLREVALVRALSVGVLLGYALWNGVAFADKGFWTLWLAMTLVDIPFSGVYRALQQRAFCMRLPLGWLTALELGLIGWFLLVPDQYARLAVLSPLVALVARTSLWGQVVTLPAPPLPLLIGMPLLWRGLMLTIAWVWVQGEWRRSRTARWRRVLEPLLIYPLYDWVVGHLTSNPVTRFFGVERRFLPASVLAGVGWVAGLLMPPDVAIGWAFLMMIPTLIALWWMGYRLASQRLMRLVETGELRQWVLTGLAPSTLYWGLVVSVWIWQVRMLIALYGCGALAAWLRAFYESLAGGVSLGAPITVMVGGGMVTFFFAMLLLLLGSQLFLAAPVAIQDTLTALSRREQPTMARATLLSLVYGGCAALACLLAPLLLVGLPIYSTRSERVLRQLARAPDEYLHHLHASAK